MVPRVLQHVDERGAHFARRGERSSVEAIREDGAAPAPETVERAGDPHEDSFHSARQRPPILGFGDQMDVIRLQRELVQPEAEAIASGGERTRDRASSRVPPKTRQAGADADRDVERMVLVQRGSRTMRSSSARTCALPTRTPPSTAPAAELELVLTRPTPAT